MHWSKEKKQVTAEKNYRLGNTHPNIAGGELMCSRRVDSFCSIGGIHRFTPVKSPVKIRKGYGIVISTIRTYPPVYI